MITSLSSFHLQDNLHLYQDNPILSLHLRDKDNVYLTLHLARLELPKGGFT